MLTGYFSEVADWPKSKVINNSKIKGYRRKNSNYFTEYKKGNYLKDSKNALPVL
jgi:hypothetical protein